MSDRAFTRFGVWFASGAGIVQTLLVVSAWIIGSRAGYFDRTGFWLLYVLTVYSGITQPVLAFIAYQASLKADACLARLEQAEAHNLAILAHQERMLTHIEALLQG